MTAYTLEYSRISFEHELGKGATAVVYQGKLDNNTDVAIKDLNWNTSKLDIAQQKAFSREVSIMGQVKHPNLVHFLGVSSKPSSFERQFCIITELCSGGSLFDFLHEHPDRGFELDYPQVHKMCFDVANAMEYLHNHEPKIIHRDLKSLNLLLHKKIEQPTDRPIVKVSDFGLSRMQDIGEDGWGKMTVEAGTHHWMAPEVWASQDYDEKIDVYSFAMIMFEIICQEIPFQDDDPAQLGKLVQGGRRPDLEAADDPAAPREMNMMVELMIRCWDQDPNARPIFTGAGGIVRQLGDIGEKWLR